MLKTSTPWALGLCLQWTADRFLKNGISENEAEAQLIFAHVLNVRCLDIIRLKDTILPEEKLARIRHMINERLSRRPFAYITGEKEFYGILFKVDESVLIPRPETELLVEKVINFAKTNACETLVDIGTGSGAIAVALAKYTAINSIYAVDLSIEALKNCQRNCDNNAVSGRVIIKQGNMFEALGDEKVVFDVIVSNPPYISKQEMHELEPELSFEPECALYGGLDGLDYYRIIAEQARKYLSKKGRIFLEMSSTRSRQIQELFIKESYIIDEIIRDYSGFERIIVLSAKPK